MSTWWSWFQTKPQPKMHFTTPPTNSTTTASPPTPLQLDQSPGAMKSRTEFKAIVKQSMEQEQISHKKHMFWPSAQPQPVLEVLMKKHNFVYQFQPAKCPSCGNTSAKCNNKLLHAVWFTSSGYQIRW